MHLLQQSESVSQETSRGGESLSQETNTIADSQKTNTIAESLPLKEACIEVIATILEMTTSDQELVPPSFVGTVTRLMKDYIFSLSLATNGLHVLTSLYPHRTPFSLCFPVATYQSAFKTEETITCLQLICYATQSQECRALTQSLLASLEAPFQISPDVPLRSDALEDILFAGLICQLDAKERSVLLDVLKVCGDALALSQQRFLHAFELKRGMTPAGYSSLPHGRRSASPLAGAAALRHRVQAREGGGGDFDRDGGVQGSSQEGGVSRVRQVPHLPGPLPQLLQWVAYVWRNR